MDASTIRIDRRPALARIAAVTGADGFIGSHLVEALVARGVKVRALAQYNPFDSWGWLDALDPEVRAEVEVELGDIRDIASVRRLAEGADVIYHLAALIAIPYSYRSPRSYVDTNVIGTLNVLEAARQLETPRMVHTSTSEVYGTARVVPITEDHPLQGQSPYSASKIAADKLAESFHLSFGLPVATLRPFNTFGPRQSARAVIPTIVSQVQAGATTIHLGDLRPTRDFTFVGDTAEAFIRVAEAPAEAVVGRVLNTGTGVETSIGDLVHLVEDVTGRKIAVVEDEERLRPPASEVMRLVCDSTRLREATGWQPGTALRQGVETTVRWFSEPANLARYRWQRYTV
jgi:NDP-hexose 4,6-dehydratase